MAKFKVGQRVRVLDGAGFPLAGHECTVRSLHDEFCGVTPDVAVHGTLDWYAMHTVLRPLTDPKADAFMASVKKWGPLHEEPKVPVVTVRVLNART